MGIHVPRKLASANQADQTPCGLAQSSLLPSLPGTALSEKESTATVFDRTENSRALTHRFNTARNFSFLHICSRKLMVLRCIRVCGCLALKLPGQHGSRLLSHKTGLYRAVCPISSFCLLRVVAGSRFWPAESSQAAAPKCTASLSFSVTTGSMHLSH